MVWYSDFFKDFPQFIVIHTVKCFSIVSEAEVAVFCLLLDPRIVGNLISTSSAFFQSNLHIWKFLVHVLLKSSLKDLGHNPSLLACEMNEFHSSVNILWHCPSLGLE